MALALPIECFATCKTSRGLVLVVVDETTCRFSSWSNSSKKIPSPRSQFYRLPVSRVDELGCALDNALRLNAIVGIVVDLKFLKKKELIKNHRIHVYCSANEILKASYLTTTQKKQLPILPSLIIEYRIEVEASTEKTLYINQTMRNCHNWLQLDKATEKNCKKSNRIDTSQKTQKGDMTSLILCTILWKSVIKLKFITSDGKKINSFTHGILKYINFWLFEKRMYEILGLNTLEQNDLTFCTFWGWLFGWWIGLCFIRYVTLTLQWTNIEKISNRKGKYINLTVWKGMFCG